MLTMGDLIERGAALASIDCCLGNSLGGREEFDNGLRQARKFVLSVPAVHWIPCVNMLPEQDGDYLVFTEYKNVFKCTFDSNEENKWGFRQDYHNPDTLGLAGTTWTAVDAVTHWMPLPKPPEKRRMETIAITKMGNASIENTYDARNGNLNL